MSTTKEREEEKVSSENVDEGNKCEVNVKGKGAAVVVMDTPERNKNQIATPISKFEESPFSNFLNNLSPIKPVKSAHFPQSLNTLSFASIPSVFTSPHVSSIRESRFLRRHLLSDPSKPEFASDNSVKVDTDEGMLDAVNNSNKPKESFGSEISVVEASHECSKLAVELARSLNYECSDSPSTLPTGGIRGKSLSDFAGSSVTYVPLVQDIFGKGLLRREVNMDGTNEIDPTKEPSGCEWENMICDATDILIFDSPGDPEAFTKATGPNFRSFGFVSNEMQNMQDFSQVSTSEGGGDGSESEKPSTQPGDETQVKEYSETQNMKPDSSLTNDGMGVGQSEKTDNEMVSTLYRGMRRRCLVFEMVGPRRKHLDEGSGSSSVQETDGNLACNEKQVLPPKTVNESSRCILPGIGLHLNALAASSKDGKVVKHEANNASGKQLLIASGSAVSLHPIVTGQESLNKSLAETPGEGAIVPFENSVPLMEDVCRVPGYVNNEELNQTSPKKKRRRLEPGEGESCKRCNCKKSKCLKLYCECFAAGVYCVEPCACQDCFNKPIHEDTVLATRKQIESRNPLAFAPKVIRSNDSLSETGDDSSKTPASARHKRGCNCKKSGCLKKYCECYQGGVGCSINCRCEGCKNAFGRKDGSIFIGTDGDAEEEETDAFEKSIVDRTSHKNIVQSDVEQNPDSAPPATPLAFRRPPMQLPFSLKNKPPRSSFLSIGSSSGIFASQGVGRPSFFQPQPKFEKPFQSIQEDEIPEILQGTNTSPISGIKTSSPNRKRVSPPHCNFANSPGRRSSRKLILQSIPSFPSLTPNP
ncbi:hypothetical protein RND71_024543 [Anisodus tanguticus]|uniref:CRC domain-containing protein n=1 Tax=Anisodus tanguticus TaxID=243964 RepID=A0AAE1RQP9_9SOLA|nr:hypothetical protein RND71_024543 [Anisodus tanguticus]